MSKYRPGCSNAATLFYSYGPIKQAPIKVENNVPTKEYQKEVRNRDILNEIPLEFENCRFGEFDVKDYE